MSKGPPQRAKDPPIVDNPTVLTVWASECPTVMLQDGVMSFTFTETRPIGDPPRIERRVVARVALSAPQAAAMGDRMRQLLFGAQAMNAGGQPN